MTVTKRLAAARFVTRTTDGPWWEAFACPVCGRETTWHRPHGGRYKRYCSNACRQKAYRERKAGA
jgi:hypothetical protein